MRTKLAVHAWLWHEATRHSEPQHVFAELVQWAEELSFNSSAQIAGIVLRDEAHACMVFWLLGCSRDELSDSSKVGLLRACPLPSPSPIFAWSCTYSS